MKEHRDHHCEEYRDELMADLLRDTIAPLSTASQQALAKTLSLSASDPYGDGDQSSIPDSRLDAELRSKAKNNCEYLTLREEAAEPLRLAWASNVDILTELRNEPFLLACACGNFVTVKKHIDEARLRVCEGENDALLHLLERRVTKLRMSALHHCCQGSKSLGDLAGERAIQWYTQTCTVLLEAGARVNARDLGGNTPLGVCSGMTSSPISLALIPILAKHGADPNVCLRFGTNILSGCIAANNGTLLRLLLLAGSSLDTGDGTCPPVLAAWTSPALIHVIMEVRRDNMLKDEKCATCGSDTATKYCSACRREFYCSRECQSSGWKQGHKDLCQNERDSDVYVEVNPPKETFSHIRGVPICGMVNPVTGMYPKHFMRCKQLGVPFMVKVSVMFPMEEWMGDDSNDPFVGCVRIEERNSDFMIVKKVGRARRIHARLRRFSKERSGHCGIAYVTARWGIGAELTPKGYPAVLNVELSRVLPPPKPLW